MSEIKSNFFKTPNAILDIKKISVNTLRILLYLLTWQNSKKGCFVKQQTIAQRLGIGIATVKRALSWLEEEGYIAIFSGKKEFDTNLYKVNYRMIDEKCINSIDENEINKIDSNRRLANQVTTKEREVRERMSKNSKNLTENN